MLTHQYHSGGMSDSFSKILKHFDTLSPEERAKQLMKLMQRYDHNFDIIGNLPKDLAGQIFMLFEPQDLCAFRLVSKNWNEKVIQDLVWRPKCVEYSMIDPQMNPNRYHDIFRRSMTVVKTWKSLNCRKYELRHHRGPVLCMLITNSGRLFTGSVEGIIYVWNTRNRSILAEINAHTQHVSCLAHFRNLLASGSSDNDISISQIDSFKQVCKLKGHLAPVTSLVFSTREVNVLFSGSVDRTIRIWDLNTEQCVRVLHGQENIISSLVHCPLVPNSFCRTDIELEMVESNQAGYLLSASSAQNIYLWDLKVSAKTDEPEVITALMETNGPVTAMALYHENVFSNAMNETHTERGVARKHLKNDFAFERRQLGLPTCLAYAGKMDPTLNVVTVPGLDKTMVQSPITHRGTIWSMLIAPIHSKIVTTSGDKTVVVWDMKVSSSCQTLGGFDSAVISSCMEQREEALCFGTEKGTVYIFDLKEFS